MNLLQTETSPYLRQHLKNPVHWMPWGVPALEKARAEGKPVLLSVGYAACHWCHVMAHESFEDAVTADLMNRNFINIKVDREERPDIDALYQSALSLMGKQGGWPLTMFLTPDAKPFWGGTYFPPEPRLGLPSFREVLRGVADSYVQDRDKIEHNVESLTAALEQLNRNQPGHIVQRDFLDKTSRYFLGLVDAAHGGIGSVPKFPNLTIMNFLWDSYIRTGDDAYKLAVIQSLVQMCQGGIYDHLGGGFSRYTVDAEWLVPHFEKMLYDNAQFISLLSEVYKETHNPLFATCISETVEWARREMVVSHLNSAAFASSIDADSEGKEGHYYVWTAAEVDKALGPDADAFKRTYDVTKFGNWDNVSILNRLKNPDYMAEDEEMLLGEWRKKLKAVRDKRTPPQRDGKVLADCNGLMIAALARAGFAFNCREWVDAAESTFRFVATHMTDKEGRLHHTWCDGKAGHTAVLDDYANMAAAALALYDVTQRDNYLTRAAAWVATVNEDFHDRESGGYFLSSSRVTDVWVRPKTAYDSALPSGNGTMAGVLARLYVLTGDKTYESMALKTAEAFSGEAVVNAFPFSTLLSNSDFLLNPVTVAVMAVPSVDIGPFDDVLRRISLPTMVKTVLPPGHKLPYSHPAFGKTPVNKSTTVYVCFGQQCLTPVTTPEALEKLLRQERHKRSRPAANDS